MSTTAVEDILKARRIALEGRMAAFLVARSGGTATAASTLISLASADLASADASAPL
jgi:hypothetical protein